MMCGAAVLQMPVRSVQKDARMEPVAEPLSVSRDFTTRLGNSKAASLHRLFDRSTHSVS